MLAIVVLAFSSISLAVFSDGGTMNPPHTPHTDLQESVDTETDTIHIFHSGGEAIDLEDTKIILYINGQQAEFLTTDPEVSVNTANGVLSLGDSIVIDTNLSKGINLKSTDAIDLYFVHTGSRQVIQKATLVSGPEEGGEEEEEGGNPGRYWITPYPDGTADDTSGGWISPEAVNESGDGIFTVYYSPDKHDTDPNATCQEFSFGIKDDEIPNPLNSVTLKITYSIHDKSYKDIALDISVEDPENWIRVSSGMPENNKKFEPYYADLTSYVHTAEELKDLKVRLVAVSNANKNAEKTLWIDFLGIHLE